MLTKFFILMYRNIFFQVFWLDIKFIICLFYINCLECPHVFLFVLLFKKFSFLCITQEYLCNIWYSFADIPKLISFSGEKFTFYLVKIFKAAHSLCNNRMFWFVNVNLIVHYIYLWSFKWFISYFVWVMTLILLN